MNLIGICHRCPKRQRPCSGPCPCTIDGQDIIVHAAEGYCPVGNYQLGLGDALAWLLDRVGVQSSLQQMMHDIAVCNAVWTRDGAVVGCGCKERQLAMNAAL